MKWLFIFLIGLILGTVSFHYIDQPVPFCKIVGDHEIVTGHCIPYCPPKPSECG